MGLREEKKKELRRQILNTSVRLFGEHGVTGTRVADIAALLRISEATFFNYFPSKQAICEEAVADVITRAIEHAVSGDAPVQEQLAELTAALVAEFTADRPLVALLRRHPEIMAAGWMRIERPQATLTNRIETAQAAGSLRADTSADVLGEMYLDSVLMTFSRALSDHKSDEQLESTLTQVLVIWTDGCASRKSGRLRRASQRLGLSTSAGEEASAPAQLRPEESPSAPATER